MKKFKNRNKWLVVLAFTLLLFASILQNLSKKQDWLTLLQLGEPATTHFETISGNYPSYKLWDDQERFLGYAIVTSGSGYGGKISVLSIIDEAGHIKNILLLENHETPLYLSKVLETGFLERFTGVAIESGLEDIDGVSGATITVEGIFTSVQKAISQIGNEQLGLDIPSGSSFSLSWKEVFVFILVVVSIICANYNFKKIRPLLLALSVFFIGFTVNYSITYSNYVAMLAGNLPVLVERPIWYVMVPGIILVTLVLGRNFYCYWLCPFGAVQEGIFKGLNLYKFSPSTEIKAKVNKIRWLSIWVVAFVALIYNNSGIAGYEPFSVFFSSDGNTAQWIIMAIVLLLSMAQLRFWCRNFCPVGTILVFSAKLKRKVRRHVRMHKDSTEPYTNSEYSFASGLATSPLTKQDKFYIFIVLVVNFLIILSLLQDMGWA